MANFTDLTQYYVFDISLKPCQHYLYIHILTNPIWKFSIFDSYIKPLKNLEKKAIFMDPFDKNPSKIESFSDPFINFESFTTPLSQFPIEERFDMPQPMECLHGGVQIPPFLSKTFDLVDDPLLDSVISWSSNGESFVVWDSVEFSRMILPKNFKHSNFSSFVRQLNTYGFRKVDADKWEFANEGFLRGKRHLLKNIQRRKSPAGSSSGSSAEGGKATMGEIEKLRKEKSLMMQEVVELQQQQCGTVKQMEAVNEKLQAAEERQKQMVSFLTKVFQNPTFLSRLHRMKEDQGKITSPSTMRKFVKHQPHDSGRVEYSSMEGQIVKYVPDFQDLATPFENPDFIPDNVASEGLTMVHELLESPDRATEGPFNSNPEDSHFKGKNVASPQLEVTPEYLEFPSPGVESMVKEDGVWSTDFETSAIGTELWGSLSNYDIPDLGVSSGFSDVWDMDDPLLAAGSSGIDKWQDDEFPFGQPKNDSI